jgi:3-oxoacyl-[acyl-carrier-protein] synthase-3
MGTIIERLDITRGGWRTRHSALRLAVASAKSCLAQAGRDPDEVDLLINAGIYRDRNLAEPALAALIQADVGAHPEDPHADAHGTFSFDVANGTCGVLTALQIVDGFLRSRTIDCALVVASDADPGRGMAAHFPFAPAGAAMLCDWRDGDYGLGPVHWVNAPDGGAALRATVGLHDARNVLRISESIDLDERFADAGAWAAHECLRHSGLQPAQLDAIVAAPARPGFRTALAARLDLAVDRITVAADEAMHTAALVAALHRVSTEHARGAHILLVAAGAGVTAGAALYRGAPVPVEA